MKRPIGVTVTAMLMSVTNAMGWMMIDWHANNANVRFLTYSTVISSATFSFWFYWRGRNWARISVMLCSMLAIVNVLAWNSAKPGTIALPRHAMIASDAVLGAFLLYWLNTPPIRNWFRNEQGMPAGHST
jgi:hypothetical protein